MLIYSSNADADRAFLRDILGFGFVDAHEGWLIFALPPAETGVHPADPAANAEDYRGQLPASMYFMTQDINAAIAELRAKGVECGEAKDEGWGISSWFGLPSGGRLGMYQPRHPLAIKL